MTVEHVRTIISGALASEPDDAVNRRAIESLGIKRTSIVISAAFAYAVMKRFSEDTPLEVVRDWVRAARANLEHPETMPHLYVEGLIRAILGEEGLAREVPNETWISIESWLIYLLVREVYPSSAEQAQFLEEAVRYADDWLKESEAQ
jgi:hypothetical protein